MRSAISKISFIADAACCRCSGSELCPDPVASAETARRLTSRTNAAASTASEPGSVMRPGATSASASAKVSATSSNSVARSSSSQALARLETRPICCADSSLLAAPVTRLTSSCASSMMTGPYSGSAVPPCMALMASSAWLVTTRSACLAWLAPPRRSTLRRRGRRWPPGIRVPAPRPAPRPAGNGSVRRPGRQVRRPWPGHQPIRGAR